MSESLPSHEETVQSFEPWGKSPPISCDGCGKKYTTKSGYLHHCRKFHPERLQNCPACGKGFLGKRGIEIHHSTQHGEKLAKKSIRCEYCDSTFERYVSNIRDGMRQFCSQQCMGQFNSEHKTGTDAANWNGGGVSLVCEGCGSEYTVQKSEEEDSRFCSYDCLYSWQSESQKGENNPNWIGGYDTYYGPNWKGIRNKAIIRDQARCQSCGLVESEQDRSLSVHHVKRMGWFKERYDSPKCYEMANKMSNLVCLCRNCHKRWEGIPVRPVLRFNYR